MDDIYDILSDLDPDDDDEEAAVIEETVSGLPWNWY